MSSKSSTILSFVLHKLQEITHYPAILVMLLLTQAACVSASSTRSVFKTPGISPAQWSRIDDECSYEAEKATASADSKTAVSYTWNKLYVMCAELKGATYVGRVSMPEDQWKRIKALCKGEAELAAAKQDSSRNRDELKEDLELECMKRNGAKFQQSYYP